MLLEPCPEKVTKLHCVGSIVTRTWDLIDDFQSLPIWVCAFNVNQVESQEIVGFVGNDQILWVESSAYGLTDALDRGQRPQNGRRCVLRLLGACGSASLWTSCFPDEVARILVALKHFVEVVFSAS